MKTYQQIFLAFALILGVTACEDAVPSTYIPQYAVEAFLFVGQPIEHVKLLRTQAVADTFSVSGSVIADADVKIIANSDTLQLDYRTTEKGGEYYYPSKDTLYKVQPNTVYQLRIRTGTATITGRTVSPDQVVLLQSVKDTLQYPKDTTNFSLSEKLRLRWTPVSGIPEYLLRVRALDTLGYGQYLTPPTEEKNRRIYRFWEKDAPKYDDITRWGFVPATDIPGSWSGFKWFGLQEITVFAADHNFVKWFKLVQFGGGSPTYNNLLGSINGDEAVGVFASASMVSDTTFLLKNQP